MTQIKQQIRDRYLAEVTALRLEDRISATETMLREAKYNARQAEVALVEYQSSPLRFLNRFLEARQRKQTELEQDARRRKQFLEDMTRQKARLEQEAEENRIRLEQLPEWDTLRRIAMENPETAQIFRKLEALYCITALQPYLERNHADLDHYGKYLRGEYMGRLTDSVDIAGIQTAPGVSGTKCRVWIRRLRDAMEQLEIPMEEFGYFENPEGYIISAAAQHNRLDRCRKALEQNEAVNRFIRRISEELNA